MKKYILLTLFLFSAYINSAQDVKYKELIDMIKRGEDKESFSVLFDFQKKNPEFANTYFHLGNISFNWTKNSDPLVDYEQTLHLIYNTKLFYNLGLSKIAAQARDAKKYDDYYKTIPEFEGIKKLENQMVISYMTEQKRKTEEYETKTAKTVNLFHNTIKSYSKTKKAFTDFITKNDNLNTILTQPSEPTLAKTNEIILLYDSALFFYEQYKTSLANYPIKNYNQKIIERPITTYRLEGLTGSNFLADTIYIWNYKEWAKSIQKKLKSDIEHFRQTIEKTNSLIDKKDKELSKLTKPTSAYDKFYIDQVVGFEVEKYDYNSIISTLFKYRAQKINYLIKSNEHFNSRTDSTFTPASVAVEYYKLSLKKKNMDSLLTVLNKKANNDNYTKHKYFFDNNYGGFEGLKQFLSTQTTDNNKRYKKDLSNLNYLIYRDVYMQSTNPKMVNYKSSEISLNVQLTEPESAEPKKYYTLSKSSFNNADYVTGYYMAAPSSIPFVAKIVNGNVEWLKILKSAGNYTSFGVKIAAQETGCILVVHSITKEGNHSNNFIRLLENGREVLTKQVSNTEMPRFIHFDDINSDIIMAFHGKKLDYFAEKGDNSLELKKINTLSGEIVIDKNIVLTGKMTNILKINSEYYLFTNFKKLGFDQSIINSNTESIGFMKLSEKGKLLDLIELKTKDKIWALYALKVNDKTISIAAYKNKVNIYKSKFQNLPAMYNLIISPKGKTIYSNL